MMKNNNLLTYQGLPLVVLLLPFLGFAIFGSDRFIKGEAGIIENLTALFILLYSVSIQTRLKQPSRSLEAD